MPLRLIAGNSAVRVLQWTCRAVGMLELVSGGLERFASGFAGATLDSQQMRSVTGHVYAHLWRWHDGLHEWEAPWFSEVLPPPPARILVGGCGRGREVSALLARGYEVWAFDPSPEALLECEQQNPQLAFSGCFAYEDLTRALANPKAETRLLPADVRFDAVLLGWGSLSHVIDESTQQALLRALDQLTPSGPILTSFLYSVNPPDEARSRAFRVGRRAGQALGGTTPRAASPRVRLFAHMGAVYYFDEPHLTALAHACGRRLEFHSDDRTRATFWPIASLVAAQA